MDMINTGPINTLKGSGHEHWNNGLVQHTGQVEIVYLSMLDSRSFTFPRLTRPQPDLSAESPKSRVVSDKLSSLWGWPTLGMWRWSPLTQQAAWRLSGQWPRTQLEDQRHWLPWRWRRNQREPPGLNSQHWLCRTSSGACAEALKSRWQDPGRMACCRRRILLPSESCAFQTRTPRSRSPAARWRTRPLCTAGCQTSAAWHRPSPWAPASWLHCQRCLRPEERRRGNLPGKPEGGKQTAPSTLEPRPASEDWVPTCQSSAWSCSPRCHPQPPSLGPACPQPSASQPPATSVVVETTLMMRQDQGPARKQRTKLQSRPNCRRRWQSEAGYRWWCRPSWTRCKARGRRVPSAPALPRSKSSLPSAWRALGPDRIPPRPDPSPGQSPSTGGCRWHKALTPRPSRSPLSRRPGCWSWRRWRRRPPCRWWNPRHARTGRPEPPRQRCPWAQPRVWRRPQRTPLRPRWWQAGTPGRRPCWRRSIPGDRRRWGSLWKRAARRPPGTACCWTSGSSPLARRCRVWRGTGRFQSRVPSTKRGWTLPRCAPLRRARSPLPHPQEVSTAPGEWKERKKEGEIWWRWKQTLTAIINRVNSTW